jgi:hypothetical protein
VQYQIKYDRMLARSKTEDPRPRLGAKDRGYLVYAMRPNRTREVVHGIFLLLAMEAFFKWTRVPIAKLDVVGEYIKMVMDTVSKAFPRKEGMGHNTIKIHLVIWHFIQDMIRYASGSNYNSGPGEKNHKDNIKKPGRNTQRRVLTFALQCARHYINMLVVMRGWKDHPNWKDDCDQQKADEEEDNRGQLSAHEKERNDCFYGVYLTVRPEAVFYGMGPQTWGGETAKKKRNSRKIGKGPSWIDSELGFKDLTDSIVREKILPKLPVGTAREGVRVYTRTLRGQGAVMYHANPCHGRHKLAKQHWAYVDLSDGDGGTTTTYPCQMLCFLEIAEDPTEPVVFDCGTKIVRKGFYALVHRGATVIEDKSPRGTCTRKEGQSWEYAIDAGYMEGWEHGSLAEPNQKIIHTMYKAMVRDAAVVGGKRLAVLAVPCDSIKKPLVGVRDPRDDRKRLDKWFYFVVGSDHWGQCFYDMAVAEEEEVKEHMETSGKVTEVTAPMRRSGEVTSNEDSSLEDDDTMDDLEMTGTDLSSSDDDEQHKFEEELMQDGW